MAQANLAADLRADLERALLAIARAGHIADHGEREIRMRVDEHHRLRWIEGFRVKVPASELEHGFDETAG